MISAETIYPARGMLLVKPWPRKEVSDGGIILPEAKKAKDKVGVESGVVFRAGLSPRNPKTGVEFPWPDGLDNGTTVYYTWTAGTEIKTAEGPFLLLLHNEIIATD